MALKLDDLFASSFKKPKKLLDISKVKIFSDADFEKYMNKVPELNFAPEKLNDIKADLKTYEKDFSFTLSKKEQIELNPILNNHLYLCEDPMPLSMRGVRMDDLASVDIHWKMLTDLRPVNKVEEAFFNRIVDLGKYRKDTKIQEVKILESSLSSVPGASAQAKFISLGFVTYKSKRGTTETKVKSCKDCGLELCTGVFCKLQHYDSYARVILDKDELDAEDAKGFSLKNVIAEATAKPGAAAVKVRSSRKNNPSLKAMLSTGRKVKKKKKSKQKEA